MPGLYGGSLGDMQQLSSHFNSESETLQSLIGRLNTDTNNSSSIWTGPAADRFRSDWQGFQPTLNKLVAALQDASKAVATNASNIEAATR